MTLIGDYHISLATALLGFANTLLLLVLIFGRDRHDDRDKAEDLLDNAPTVSHVPDPDTGLVPCGCGGKAYCNDDCMWVVSCEKCRIATAGYWHEFEAAEDWNQAMGGVRT